MKGKIKMKIKATAERMEVLDENEIKYKIDTDFNFVFSCPKEETKARLALENALEI